MKKVVELYRNLLPAMGLTLVGDQIHIGGGEYGAVSPVVIDDKNLFLPTEGFLKNSEFRDQIAFHPLAEDILKKRSPVLTAMQNAFNFRLYSAGVFLVEALLKSCVKQKRGEEISSPKLLSYLTNNEDCDEKTLLFFKSLVEVMNADKSRKFFNVYLRHASDQNEGNTRQCVITCPLVTELDRIAEIASTKTGSISVWGVTPPRKKDVGLLMNLIKTIFPGIENRSYSTGSSDRIAPYSDAFFLALKNINEDIVSATKALSKQEPVTTLIEFLCIDLNAIDEMLAAKNDYDIFRNSIVKTAYNDGDGYTTEIKRPTADSKPVTHVVERKPEVKVAEDPVAITKEVIRQSVKPIPGTRQPLITGITEDDYRTVKRDPRYPSDRNGGYAGNSREERYERDDRRPKKFRDSYEVEDEIKYIYKLIDDAEYNRNYREADDLKYELTGLKRLLEDYIQEERRARSRDSNYEDRRSNHRDERDYGSRSRPVPRAVEENRNRSYGSRGTDRFGRR